MNDRMIAALKAMESEWTPAAIQQAFENGGNRTIAIMLYEEQAKYVGSNHANYCYRVIEHFLNHLPNADLEALSYEARK